MSKDTEQEDLSFEGCYGSKVAYSDMISFMDDAFAVNLESEKSGSERFSTCVWGHSGCVLEDTVVRVRKRSDKGIHRINVSPSIPVCP